MKKVLALVLVLGMASLANAGFILTGPDSMFIGDKVTITVGHDVAGLNSLGALISVVGSAQMSNLQIIAANQDPFFSVDYGGGVFGTAANSPAAVLASPIATFDLTGLDLGGVLVRITDEESTTGGSYSTGFEQVFLGSAEHFINIIPEPMTMSLLALGGLGLLRRRRN